MKRALAQSGTPKAEFEKEFVEMQFITAYVFVESVTNLGVIVNKQLNWSDHIKANCAKTFAMLRNLWMTQYFAPIHIRMLFVTSRLIIY